GRPALQARALRRDDGLRRRLRRHSLRWAAHHRRFERRHPLHHRSHGAGGGRYPDGGVVVEQQVVAARRHPVGRADRELRDCRGMRNRVFVMAECGDVFATGAIVPTLILGGWQIPWAPAGDPIVRTVLQFACFFLKSYFWVFVAIWLRWTLPRIRVAQMMSMCWKYLVPLAFVNLLGTAVWMVVFPNGAPGVPQLLCVAAAVLVWVFFGCVCYPL